MTEESRPPQVIVTQPSWEERITKLVMAAIVVSGIVYVSHSKGENADQTIQRIKEVAPLFMAKAPEQKTTETVTVTATPREPTVAPAAELSPSDIQRWIDLFKPLVIEIIQSIPKPPIEVPPPVTPPVVVTPPVKPPVTPPPSGMKLVFTDSSKVPITSSSVPTDRIIRVMAENSSSKVGWSVATHGRVDVFELPNDLGYDFELRESTAYVDFTLFDTTLTKVTQRITANQAPQPPPVVDPPPVVVTPPSVPPGTKTFDVYVVEDGNAIRTVATAKILSNLQTREVLKSRGHKFAGQVANDGSGASTYVKAQGTPLPALVIFDRQTSQWVKSVPLPDDLGLNLLSGLGG